MSTWQCGTAREEEEEGKEEVEEESEGGGGKGGMTWSVECRLGDD